MKRVERSSRRHRRPRARPRSAAGTGRAPPRSWTAPGSESSRPSHYGRLWRSIGQRFPAMRAAAVAPRAAAVRSMVPTFPGSWTASSTTIRARVRQWGASPAVLRDLGDGENALRRLGLGSAGEVEGGTSAISTPAVRRVPRRAAPRGASASWGATSTPRTTQPRAQQLLDRAYAFGDEEPLALACPTTPQVAG